MTKEHNPDGIGSKLGWCDLIKIENLRKNNARKLEPRSKEFLINRDLFLHRVNDLSFSIKR